MGQDFWIKINNPERAEEFKKVFDKTYLNVKSAIPEWCTLPGKGRCKIYKLDLDLISLKERERLISYIAEKFNLPPETVDSELDRIGMPILAEDCTVIIERPQVWLS